MLLKRFLLLLLAINTTACTKEEVTEKKPLQSIAFGFETTLEDWVALGGSGERKFDNDILIVTDVATEGIQSCQFTVSPESSVSGGTRAELTFDQQAVQGDDTWYEYSFYIPADYQDVELFDDSGIVNWQVLGQWHHQPVFADGEDWDNYSGEGASPPIALYYNYLSTSDPGYQNMLNDPNSNTVFGFDASWNNVSTISIVYGTEAIAIFEIKKEEWNHIKLNIKWSQESDGHIQVWNNGIEVTNGKVLGANMLNKASHYFKFGLYRNPNIPYTNKVYFDDVSIY